MDCLPFAIPRSGMGCIRRSGHSLSGLTVTLRYDRWLRPECKIRSGARLG